MDLLKFFLQLMCEINCRPQKMAELLFYHLAQEYYSF